MSDAPEPTSAAAAAGEQRRGVPRTSAALLAQALASDDAEESGVRAAELLADPALAVESLGHPDAPAAARHAVVQRYGRVGALLVIGYEERWRASRLTPPGGDAPSERRASHVTLLDHLLDGFSGLDADAMDTALAGLDEAEGMEVHGETSVARRWLHATYAVAARDGTEAAHRAYMVALDRVMRLAAPRIAS
ncbi:MAG TPA: hypothetical protein VKR22_13260 [Acidimicrobiales bacterium]|nr:hypothetical protein [Acidimicrobiales bacterium]